MMENASYIASILEIDYNRCYKFALKNPFLTKEQLLEQYFQNTNELVWMIIWIDLNLCYLTYFYELS